MHPTPLGGEQDHSDFDSLVQFESLPYLSVLRG